jgi:NAD(P)-dependent dehydrogenase (short-subunit alcohol dehydrogenase family)
MTGRLYGKVALVTGGSSGIGRASALAFAREGSTVIVADVNAEGGEETVHLIKEADGEAIFVRADVSQAAEVEALIDKTVESYGRLDCAFNNAGIGGAELTPTADYPEDIWDQVISINLKGVWLCMKYEIQQMLKQGGGVIVNMASVVGLVGSLVTGAAYVASKHGVTGLTKTAAIEYAQQGIRVNAVCPGWIQTPLTEPITYDKPQLEQLIIERHPMGRVGAPEEVAEAVVWLCSDAASFVTGHSMAIDGGFVAQ